jgi:hypothetical protein
MHSIHLQSVSTSILLLQLEAGFGDQRQKLPQSRHVPIAIDRNGFKTQCNERERKRKFVPLQMYIPKTQGRTMSSISVGGAPLFVACAAFTSPNLKISVSIR